MDTAILKLLADARLFCGLERDQLEEVSSQARDRQYARHDYLFHEGETAHSFFLLTEGRVKLVQTTEEGHQVTPRVIGPGQVFGAVAMFGGRDYPVSAQALCSCSSLMWHGPTMTRLMERFPALAMNALKIVATRLHELQEQYRDLVTERAGCRIARTLLRISQRSGGDPLEDLPFSRQDLAEMTGTTQYTVSRILKDFEKQGLIRTGRERVAIIRPRELAIAAELEHFFEG